MIYWKDFNYFDGCDVATVADNKKQKYKNIALSFDIETSTTEISGDAVAFMYVWQFGINGVAVYGRTWSEFTQFLVMLKKYLRLGRDETAVIYVHNLAFEFAFVAPYLQIKNVFARSPHHPIYFTTYDGFEFRCSYFLTGKSLAAVSEETTVKKLVGDLDYSLLRHSTTKLTEQELAYCENDVLILNEYINREIRRNGDITKIPLTKTGYVRREVLQAFQASPTWADYQRFLRFTYPRKEVFALLNKCFSGGFTHANCDYVGLTLENISSVDLASSYPAQMLKHKFPWGNWVKLGEIADRDTLDKLCNKYGCIMEITYKNLRAKSSHHTISRHKCSVADNAVIDNGRIVSGDYITTYITSVDYKINSLFYDWDAVQVHEFYYAKLQYLPAPLIHTILNRYEQKTRLKGAKTDADKLNYSIAKQFINSLYGMTVQNPLDDNVIYNNGLWKIERGNVDGLLKRNKMSNKYCLPYAVGVFVTAFARWELLSTIAKIGDDAAYCDTDSIKMRNYEKHKHIIDEYNEQNRRDLYAAMDYHGIDRERVEPLGKLIGVFEFEGKYDEFKTLGAKRYCYTDENGENFNYTVAGLPKSKGNGKTPLEYMRTLTDETRTLFDVFEFDLEIPAKWSKKMESIYNLTPWRKFVTDYNGKRDEAAEMFGVALRPIGFTMGICREFFNFLGLANENDYSKNLPTMGSKPDILKINPLD